MAFELDNTKLLILTGLGISWIFGGIVLSFYAIPIVVEDQIHKKIMLQNGSEMYPMWQKLPVPIQFNAYLFNVTNPEEVHGGAKPIVQEIGPFCYNLFREKVILEVKDGFITYDSRRLFYDRHDRGCVSTETQVTILNFALLGTVHIMLNLIPDFLETFEETIPLMFPDIKNIFTTAKAKDILFNGLLLDCSNEDQILGLVCTNVKGLSPPQVWQAPNGKDYLFAALHYMNDSSEGIFTAKDGVENVEDVGGIVAFEGESRLNFWMSDDCNEIAGTDAYIFPPPGNKTELVIFQIDVCRKMVLEFQSETEIFGIPATHFAAAKVTFEAGDVNKCYCVKHVDEETKEETIECLKNGAQNLSPCFKAPVIVTWPHFLEADEEYRSYVIGLRPNKSKHQSEVYIQTKTGIVLRGAKKAQINMFLIKNEDISILNTVSEGLFPILWIEEGADVPNKYKKLLKTVVALLKILEVSKPVAPLIGFCMCCLAVFFYSKQNKKFCFAPDNQIDISHDEKLPENDYYASMKNGGNISTINGYNNEINNQLNRNGNVYAAPNSRFQGNGNNNYPVNTSRFNNNINFRDQNGMY